MSVFLYLCVGVGLIIPYNLSNSSVTSHHWTDFVETLMRWDDQHHMSSAFAVFTVIMQNLESYCPIITWMGRWGGSVGGREDGWMEGWVGWRDRGTDVIQQRNK